MIKPQPNKIDVFDKCACGREKRKFAYYCSRCSADIGRLRTQSRILVDKEKRDAAAEKLKQTLIFHGTYHEPIKTKAMKLKEKRDKEKHP
jgi:hypothetical protein